MLVSIGFERVFGEYDRMRGSPVAFFEIPDCQGNLIDFVSVFRFYRNTSGRSLDDEIDLGFRDGAIVGNLLFSETFQKDAINEVLDDVAFERIQRVLAFFLEKMENPEIFEIDLRHFRYLLSRIAKVRSNEIEHVRALQNIDIVLDFPQGDIERICQF